MPLNPADRRRALAVSFFAATVSFAWVGRPSFWYDEAATIAAADRPLISLWHLVGHRDLVHGVYYLFMHGWVSVFGAGEVALRLPSVIGVGVAGYTTYVLGLRLGGTTLASLAGLIAAVLPGLSWAGTEARSMAWTVVLASVASLCLLAALRSGRTRDWVLYSAVITVATYLFLYCCLLLVCHLVTVLVLRRRIKQWALAAAAAMVAVSPFAVRAEAQKGQIAWIHWSIDEMMRRAVLRQYFLGSGPTSGDRLEMAAGVLLGALCLSLAALVLLKRKQDDQDHRLLVALALPWAVVPASTLILVSALGTPTYAERYALFGAPAVALLVARGCMVLGSLAILRRRRLVAGGCLTVIALLATPVLVQQKAQDAKGRENYRAAAAFAGPDGPGVDAVIYAHDAALGVPISYPEPFRQVRELNRGTIDETSSRLFGRARGPRWLTPADVAGKTIGLYRIKFESNYPFFLWLQRQGCAPAAEGLDTTRLNVILYQCR
jgi:mannosyltransferase